MHYAIESARTINRRRHFRRADHCDVQIQAIDAPLNDSEACSHFCVSHDVSASGIRLIADRPYPLNSQLLLTMECKQNGWTRIVSRVGSVVWTKQPPEAGQCQIGIRFTDVDAPDLEELI